MVEDTSTADEYEYQYWYTERLRRLLQIESNLSDGFRSALNGSAKSLLLEDNSFFNDVDTFYRDLDASKHSEEDVTTLIRCIPVRSFNP